MIDSIHSIGILLYDDVELLDFSGPMQVFLAARYLKPYSFEKIETFATEKIIRVAKSDMFVGASRRFHEVEHYDMLVIPGGIGSRAIINNESTIKGLRPIIDGAKIVTSVCTGSLILARMGYLSELKATTHFGATQLLSQLDPTIDIDRTKRYHDHGRYIIAEGVSAGIDMAFYVVEKLHGSQFAGEVRKYLEYYPEKD